MKYNRNTPYTQLRDAFIKAWIKVVKDNTEIKKLHSSTVELVGASIRNNNAQQ